MPAPRHPPPHRAAAGVTAEVRTKALTATNIIRILLLFIDASYAKKTRRSDQKLHDALRFCEAFEVLGGNCGAVTPRL
jgi:hypothetical protein